jgi:hypothetical protein
MHVFGEAINKNHAECPYSITNATMDNGGFICFDLSEIIEAYGVTCARMSCMIWTQGSG